ncbi:hypothetical protein I3760_01G121700 [Carya illinoinensis]|nr:hypothetical protein I3760_01G121700 [Carya illinoinensis]
MVGENGVAGCKPKPISYLGGLFNTTDQESCVFEVHHRLRQINVEAYEPGLLAIGPYHHGKGHLSFMEKHKLRFLQRMLKRMDENSAERYITAMRKREERVCRFYADQFPKLSSNEFVEMMLLDGCFIIELFRIRDDTIHQTDWMIDGISCDLLLFENQLPFFILTELFKMSEGCNQQYDDAHHGSTSSANQSEKNQTVPLGSRSTKSSKQVFEYDQKHEISNDESSDFKDVSESVRIRLLNCALDFFSLGSFKLSCELNLNGSSSVSTTDIKHLLGLIHKAMSPPPYKGKSSIPNVIELQEVGVKFKKAETVMEIPPLDIGDNTRPIFLNLIAYEQYSRDIRLKYVTHFATLMDHLINTPKDVELLHQNGIINNWMGDDKVVSNMFNRFCHYAYFGCDFYYAIAGIIKEVNEHCDRPWNRWMAKLRRDYFNSPWALLSVLAAVLLLLLAIAQIVFSILSYIFN